MTLGELITALEAADPTRVVKHGFTHPHSYRGDYMDLAFEPAADVPVGDMLAAARSALGTTYQGWKGGDFTMSEHTWCWLSVEGDVSGETISALLLELILADPPAAALPEPADRAAVYAEVADRLAADAEQGEKEGFTRIYRRSAAKQVREWGDELRRMADEAQQPTQRDIRCADAFWLRKPHGPHDWQQGPDAPPVPCPGVGEEQQPETQALFCVCGAPAQRDGDRWTHRPGTGDTCLYRPDARPRCPDCRVPHDLTPGGMAMRACASILASIADRDATEPAVGAQQPKEA